MDNVLLDGYGLCGRLNAAIRTHRSAVRFAHAHNLDEQRVRDAAACKSVHTDVANALGLFKVWRYPLLSDPSVLATPKQIQEKLNTFIRSCGTQSAAAHKIGISKQHLSNIQNTARGFGETCLRHLGYGKPVARYVPMDA
ncbi:hypothetical protein K6W36_09110 [Acetobacter senegalensis]|uniref:hypothetical protein n=1 Tax=Acetobacter senegalensis TaxID=446692 RepID=UPI001EDBFC41|nr:hypothetical protein [Acetobacter senegalensis]MCG4260744.1 hypothetical protein [Acetobacter senegalensis]